MTCVHDLHLKPISHSVAVSIQEMASKLTDELPNMIVYNKVTVKLVSVDVKYHVYLTVKNTDYQAHF